MVLRLAEQYLIRAEARIHLKKFTGPGSAEADLNIIRNRAGLPNTTSATDTELLRALEQERRIELFTEWGHRFFDLRRLGRLDAVMATVKPNLNSYNGLLPIPQTEILNNINLRPQNSGY
jgi:starch-binding outer membrane protein, SusD/RagB family